LPFFSKKEELKYSGITNGLGALLPIYIYISVKTVLFSHTNHKNKRKEKKIKYKYRAVFI